MGASYRCDTGVGNCSKLPSRRLRRFLWKLPGERCVCSRVPLAGHLGWPAVQNKHPAPEHQHAQHCSTRHKKRRCNCSLTAKSSECESFELRSGLDTDRQGLGDPLRI